jgi:surface antigen
MSESRARSTGRARTALLLVAAVVAALMSLLTGAGPASAHVGTNDYPYRSHVPSGVDRWDFYIKQCTSFAAWRLNNDNGVHFNNHYKGVHWGSAYNWDNAARAAGIPVNHTPKRGAIAQFNAGVDGVSSGHVAYLLKWTKSRIYVEDYNWISNSYDKHWLGRTGVNFIHLGSPGHDPN